MIPGIGQDPTERQDAIKNADVCPSSLVEVGCLPT
jgi:hypothetical protein